MEEAFANRVHAEEGQKSRDVHAGQGPVATDDLGIPLARIDETNESPRFCAVAFARAQSGTKNQGVEGIAVPALYLGDGAIVVGTGERRDEIHPAVSSPLDESAAANLDLDRDFARQDRIGRLHGLSLMQKRERTKRSLS